LSLPAYALRVDPTARRPYIPYKFNSSEWEEYVKFLPYRILWHVPLCLLVLGTILIGCSSNPVADSTDKTSPATSGQETMKISVGVDSETPQPDTPVEFEMPEGVAIFLEVTNATGYQIKTLVHGELEGTEKILWDGSNEDGVMVPTGIYMFHLTYGDESKWTPFKYVK